MKKWLIDANALLIGICKDCGNGCDLENNYCLLATEIMKAPTVDAVEVVHGRWIPSDIDVDEYEQCMSDANDWYDWECSVCHYQMSYVDPVQRKHLTNYCPNCGARMDKGEEL